MRKTKIICTIGPSSENIETLTKMCQEGMNVARLNFSHGSHEEHQNKINLVKEARERVNMPIALILDTKGPEYRIKTFENGISGRSHVTFGTVFTNSRISGYSKPVSTNTAGTSGNALRTKSRSTVESFPPEKETAILPP